MSDDLLIVPNLVGGVSQQAEAIRLDTQMEEQINAYGTVLNGLAKRPPTKWLSEIATDEFAPLRIHTIERDGGEAYLLVLGHQSLRVFDLEGREYPVRNGASIVGLNYEYLDLNRESHDVADLGVWSNDAQAFAPSNLGSSTHPLGEASNVYALTNIVQAGASNANWTRASTAKVLNGKMLVSVYVTEASYSNVPEATILKLTDTTAGVSATATFRHASGVWSTQGSSLVTDYGIETVGAGWYRLWMVVDPDYPSSGITAGNAMELGINCTDDDGTVQRSINATEPQLVLGASELLPFYLGPEEIRTVTIQDTTIIAAPGQTPAEDATTTTAFDDTKGIVHVRQGAYSTEYEITVELVGGGTVTASCDTWDGVTASVSGNLDSIDTQAIAGELASNLSTAGGASGISASAFGSLVVITASSAAIQAITTEDGLGDEGIQSIFRTLQSFTDLPEEGLDGYKVEIVGQTGTDSDDYWVEFANDLTSNTGTGIWREAVAPGVTFQLDAETLPHKLERLQDDASGTATGTAGAVYFEWDVIDWEDRTAGDTETNPSPTFVGQPIRDVFFHENRFGILAGPNVLLSSSGNYFNFYRTTVRSLPDDDPIDLAINSQDVGRLDSAIPFQGRLLIHTEEGDWGLGSEDFLSPGSAAVNRLHSYESTPRVQPVSTGSSLLFPYSQGGYSGFREVVRTGDETFDAPSITQQVPRYIAEDLDFCSSTTVGQALVCGVRRSSTLFVHNWYTDGGRRIQSAWSKFEFDGAKVVDAVFLNETLYLLVERGEGLNLEALNLWVGEILPMLGVLTSQDDILPHLDQYIRLSDPRVAISNRGPTQLDVTVPFRLDSNLTYKAIGLNAGDVQDVTVLGPNTCWVDGINVATQEVSEYVLGVVYEMDVTLARPTYRQESPNGGRVQIGDARIHLNRGYVFVDETGFLEIEVTIPERTDTQEVGDSSNFEPVEGEYRFPILALSKDTVIRFKTSSPLPCRLTNLELNGRVARRVSSR